MFGGLALLGDLLALQGQHVSFLEEAAVELLDEGPDPERELALVHGLPELPDEGHEK